MFIEENQLLHIQNMFLVHVNMWMKLKKLYINEKVSSFRLPLLSDKHLEELQALRTIVACFSLSRDFVRINIHHQHTDMDQ